MDRKFEKNGISRREFIRNSALAATGLYVMPYMYAPYSNSVTNPILTRDLNVDLLINQVGYVPMAGKHCVTKGTERKKFEVIDIVNQETVHTGKLTPREGDFGKYLTGDFSSLNKEGRYYIKTKNSRSYPFSISKSVYHPVMNDIRQYFSRQRCGASETGYLSPCHLDDGLRIDNGKHQDVTGGWHDACDLRKWVDATIYGMIGLAKALKLQKNRLSRKDFVEELHWGNKYFLKMQEPEGFVMNFIGGDIRQGSDSNRWTDNIIEKGNGDPELVNPTTERSPAKMLIFSGSDDRIIQTLPVGMVGQYHFIAAEALMADITKDDEPEYSQKCLHAADKCFQWCLKQHKKTDPSIIGAAMRASLEMYQTTQKMSYKNFAIEQTNKLKELQATNKKEPRGFFYNSSSKHEPHKAISDGCIAFISLCDLVELFPSHKNAASWKTMIANYAHHYLSMMSKRNSFGIIPYGFYAEKNPGGDRKIGSYYYRYFMQPKGWWVGINSNLATAGIGLIKAANVLQDKTLKIIAQKQLDWIIGVNPFNSSTIVGVGYNQPKLFINGTEFKPPVPAIRGGVMNGLGGNMADRPYMGDGVYHVSEYWTPMVAHTLWLMAEIS